MVTKRGTLCDTTFLDQILAWNPKMDVHRAGEATFPIYWGGGRFFAKIYELTLFMLDRRQNSLNIHFLAQTFAYDAKMILNRWVRLHFLDIAGRRPFFATLCE